MAMQRADFEFGRPIIPERARKVHLDVERFRLRREIAANVARRARLTVHDDLHRSRLVAELEVELLRFMDRGRLELPAGTLESAKADAYRWVRCAVWPRWLAGIGKRVRLMGLRAERRWPVRMRTFEAVGYLPELVGEAGRGAAVAVWRP